MIAEPKNDFDMVINHFTSLGYKIGLIGANTDGGKLSITGFGSPDEFEVNIDNVLHNDDTGEILPYFGGTSLVLIYKFNRELVCTRQGRMIKE